MAPLRSPLSLLTVLAALALSAAPAASQEGEGSAGGAVVGGLVGGAVGLLSFYPLSACPMITVGAAREADLCDAGGVAAGVAGLAGGIWAGATDAGAGYGMAMGALTGVGASWLVGRLVATPRWLDAALVVTGTVAGGLLGASDGEESPPGSEARVRVPLGSLPVR